MSENLEKLMLTISKLMDAPKSFSMLIREAAVMLVTHMINALKIHKKLALKIKLLRFGKNLWLLIYCNLFPLVSLKNVEVF